MSNILTQSWFERDTATVARELLGKYLVHNRGGKIEKVPIIETEAYIGPHDLACHASKGRTKRTEVMFGPPGHWYVYLIYGMYHMLNIVTETEGHPSAVLIRGAGIYEGPGILTRDMGINSTFNAKIADKASGLWIEEGNKEPEKLQIKTTPRIGVEYAKEWAIKPLRFVLEKELTS